MGELKPGEVGVHAQFEGGCHGCGSEVAGPLMRSASGHLLFDESDFEDLGFEGRALERDLERGALTGLL